MIVYDSVIYLFPEKSQNPQYRAHYNKQNSHYQKNGFYGYMVCIYRPEPLVQQKKSPIYCYGFIDICPLHAGKPPYFSECFYHAMSPYPPSDLCRGYPLLLFPFLNINGISPLLFHRPILALRLELHHAGIDTILFQKHIRTALLRHCSVRENNNLIRPGNGTHTVGDNHYRLILNQP